MNAAEMIDLLDGALSRLEGARDELRTLDGAIGDGDLGITVAGGAASVRTALSAEASPTPADVLRTAGRSFAKANPSTFSGLIAAVLLAAAKQLADRSDLQRSDVQRLLDTAVTTIQARGGAQVDDKTVLDGVVASADALRAAPAGETAALAAMVAAAGQAVERTTGLRSQKGRAAWVGDRSMGQRDGGTVAYLRFLQALAASWSVPAPLDASLEPPIGRHVEDMTTT